MLVLRRAELDKEAGLVTGAAKTIKMLGKARAKGVINNKQLVVICKRCFKQVKVRCDSGQFYFRPVAAIFLRPV